ncbi:peptidoglycan-binding domain-containing protein [Streptomyces sp. NPDC054796]
MSGTSAEGPGALVAAGGDGDGDSTETSSPARRRRRPLRTSLLVVVAIAVAAAAGLAATGALGGDSTDSASAAPSGPPATTKVKRTTLSSTETVDGNLGYGDTSTVQAPASSGSESGGGSDSGQSAQSPQSGQASQGDSSGDSGSAGIVTWMPGEGDTIKRGDAVYSVDQQKVPLLYGSTPLYRTLQSGVEGDDVEILEKNLSKLGYDGFTVDEEFTSGTAEAVQEWQDDLGREETGTVKSGDAVIADGARRVADTKASPGGALSGELLSWTGTERVITVDLDVEYEDSVKKGTKASITLPDNTSAEAEVTDVGTPTTPKSDSESSDSGESEDSDTPTLPVELKVDDQKKLGNYQAASVDVELKDETRENVLAVPINALVAEGGGGYAVEVVTSKGSEYRPVKVGLFANSLVEVSGKGITEGLVVGVPK